MTNKVSVSVFVFALYRTKNMSVTVARKHAARRNLVAYLYGQVLVATKKINLQTAVFCGSR